jgi:hypothetical protein
MGVSWRDWDAYYFLLKNAMEAPDTFFKFSKWRRLVFFEFSKWRRLVFLKFQNGGALFFYF